MRTKFLSFFFLVAFTITLSILDSWITQYQLHGHVNFLDAVIELALAWWILYLLWQRSTSGYVLALICIIIDVVIYGDELVGIYVFGNQSIVLPFAAVIASTLLIISAVVAVIIFGLDYLDYRKRRIV